MLHELKTEASPLSQRQIDCLQQGLDLLDPSQTAWLSGYLAGRLAADRPVAVPTPDSAALQVLYASQTGHGEALAIGLAEAATAAGFSVRARNVLDLRPAEVRRLEYAVFVVSTHGEGDPPDDAVDLFEYLQSARPPDLKGLEFSILALGDRSYEQFCAAGRKLEDLLLACGAQAFAPRVDCDVDYDQDAAQWSEQVIAHVRENQVGPDSGAEIQRRPAHLSVVSSAPAWDRSRPFPATVERLQRITGPDSTKEVYHIELSLEDSGLHYEPGDALGVWAPNAPESVEALLEALNIDPATPVEADGGERSIRELLIHDRELTRLAPETVKGFAAHARDDSLQRRLDACDEKGLRRFMEERQFIDLAEEFPATLTAAELASLLRPLTPRSYSIASSQTAVDAQVHLTVVTRIDQAPGGQRHGLASHYLNSRLQPGDEPGVFLEPNRRFRLPEDRSTPLILIATGTGIAPYRAFLQQLEEEGQSPRTWLIFGNPHLRSDFLYQREWLRWRKSGFVQRIDGAFSRDQEAKRYVQDVVREQARDICEWLDAGARIYLCGALAMGEAVETALRQAVAGQRGLDQQAAGAFMSDLRRDRRLLKDLY